MQLDIFNIDDFVKANKCPQVTNPIFFNFDGTPTADGLFSYELFGFSDDERKNIFGYIDLKSHYLHPLVYQIMQSKMGSLGKVVNGDKWAVIADKKIKIVDEDFEGAETGIDFIYDHFEEINWINEIEEDEIDSLDKKTRLKFLKSLKKDEFFVTKWLVLPPFYRAESSINRSMGDNINKLYKELISKVRSMNLGFSFTIFGAETKLRVQNILKDLYLSTLAPLSGKNLIFEKGSTVGTLAGAGKNSMVRKHLLGKGIDWSASSVITSPENNGSETIEDKPVPFGYGRFPMATLLSLFQPFYLNWCSDFIENYLNEFLARFSDKIKKIDVAQYSAEKIETLIKKFIKDTENRFDPIKFTFIDINGKKMEGVIKFYEFKTKADADENKNYIKRDFTLMDLFYLASKEICEDKHVYVTRFPIANFQNIYPSKIKILSTAKTRRIYYKLLPDGDPVYEKEYPSVPLPGSNKNDSKVFDVMVCGNAYLESLGRRL